MTGYELKVNVSSMFKYSSLDADEHCNAVTDISALPSRRARTPSSCQAAPSLLVTPGDSWQQLGFPPLWIPLSLL